MILVILLVILIILNGLLAGSEIAFNSLDEKKLKTMVEKNDRKAAVVLKLKEMPKQILSTIKIGVSFASVLSGVITVEVFASLFTDWILVLANLPSTSVKIFSIVVISLITSYIILVFGNLIPKALAMAEPQKFAFLAIYPLITLIFITKPIVKFLSFSANFLLKLIGVNPELIKEAVTEEEIRKMVDDGEISPIEKEMIENIFKFDDMEVTEMMTHRTDVVAINSDSSFDEILDLVHQERFTRYPVYHNDIDSIIGVIHLRELLHYIQTEVKKDFVIHDLLTKAYFVPDSKEADELFRELQIQQTHMGIVIDEYGGTAGIVTMENLIEEVMGEIADEYDEKKESGIVRLAEDNYLIEGSCELDDLEEILKIGLPIKRYETLNGFIIGRLGRIPSGKDLHINQASFTFNGYLFLFSGIEERVVSKVRVKKITTKEKLDRTETKE